MSTTELATYIDAAVTANEAGDYATALSKVRSAELTLLKMPDAEHGSAKYKYARETIDALKRDLRRAANASAWGDTAIKQTTIEPTAPTT